MIKINLVREGRAAVKGVPTAAAAGPRDINNTLLFGLIILGVLICAGYWLLKNRTLHNKEEQVASQRIEAQKLEKIIAEVERFKQRKETLERRIDLINRLKQNQKGPVRILDHVSQDLPDLVWLDNMTMSGNSLSVQGRSLNPNAFATYVLNIKNDTMFDEPAVGVLQEQGLARGGVTVYGWNMTFHFTWQPPEEKSSTQGTESSTAPGAAPPAGEAPAGSEQPEV